MSSLRCSPCGVSWPAKPDYQPCPKCKGKTDSLIGNPTVDDDEARSIKLHCEFDEFYDGEWQQRKLQAAVDEIAALPTAGEDS